MSSSLGLGSGTWERLSSLKMDCQRRTYLWSYKHNISACCVVKSCAGRANYINVVSPSGSAADLMSGICVVACSSCCRDLRNDSGIGPCGVR